MREIEEKFEGTVAGVVKSFSDDSITVDVVEYISEDDTARLKELGAVILPVCLIRHITRLKT